MFGPADVDLAARAGFSVTCIALVMLLRGMNEELRADIGKDMRAGFTEVGNRLGTFEQRTFAAGVPAPNRTRSRGQRQLTRHRGPAPA